MRVVAACLVVVALPGCGGDTGGVSGVGTASRGGIEVHYEVEAESGDISSARITYLDPETGEEVIVDTTLPWTSETFLSRRGAELALDAVSEGDSPLSCLIVYSHQGGLSGSGVESGSPCPNSTLAGEW